MRYLKVVRSNKNVDNEEYLVHHGIKGQKWGVRHDPEKKSINRRKWNRGKKLYEKGRTISQNEDKRAQIRRPISLIANISTAATPIALFAMANSNARYSNNPVIRGLARTPMWMVPFSGGITNVGIRAVGRMLETPIDAQNSDMRYYYNRRSE